VNTPTYLLEKASGLDVVALLPAHIGFTPQDSIVVGAVHPPRGRLGVVVRLDRLRADRDVLRELAAGRADWLRQSGARASFLVRYAPPGAEAVEEDEAFWVWADVLGERLPVIGCWDVMGEAHQELDPAARRRIGPVFGPQDLQSTRAAATLALAGLAPKARREDLARIELAPEAARKAARAAQLRARDQTLALGPEQLRGWRLAGLEVWARWQRRLLQRPGAAVPPSQLGRLAALLADQVARDAVMASAFVGAGEAPKRIVCGGDASALFDPWASRGVDQDLADASLDLLTQVASHLTPRRRGAVYALGATWHWWCGNGPAAEEWARAAMDCHDCPQLAALVLAVLEREIFPAALQRLAA
jgi:hypothetical protein